MKRDKELLMILVVVTAFGLIVFGCGVVAHAMWRDPCAPSIQGQDSTITRS